MTTRQILKNSFTITTSQSGLWTLGIFLSSGFNLHWWYLLAWLKGIGVVNQGLLIFKSQQINRVGQVGLLLIMVVIFVLCLVVFNLIKLWFFGRVHQNLHSQLLQKCFLCKRLVDSNIKKLIWRRDLIWRTCLASLITIGSTVVTLTAFRFLLDQANYISGQSVLLVICLIIILVGISLWNMLTVLFIFWYEYNFTKASFLALDFLFSRYRRLMSFTLILTIIFLLAISLGSAVIWQLPNLFTALPNIISQGNFIKTTQNIISGLAGLLFLGWLVINNIFFNVAILMLFDDLISANKDKDIVEVTIGLPTDPVAIHH